VGLIFRIDRSRFIYNLVSVRITALLIQGNFRKYILTISVLISALANNTYHGMAMIGENDRGLSIVMFCYSSSGTEKIINKITGPQINSLDCWIHFLHADLRKCVKFLSSNNYT
jgi:hypothetical protein